MACPCLLQVLQRARGVDNVEIELEDIVEAARQSRMIKNPYITILQRKYRPQLVIACIFMIFQQFDVSLYRQRIIPSHPHEAVAHSTRTYPPGIVCSWPWSNCNSRWSSMLQRPSSCSRTKAVFPVWSIPDEHSSACRGINAIIFYAPVLV